MELDDLIWMVKDHVRNYFNERNSPNSPPEDTPVYQRFLRICGRMHNDILSGKFIPLPYSSEMVVGLHQWSAATGADGKPLNILQAYAGELKAFHKMFTGV